MGTKENFTWRDIEYIQSTRMKMSYKMMYFEYISEICKKQELIKTLINYKEEEFKSFIEHIVQDPMTDRKTKDYFIKMLKL